MREMRKFPDAHGYAIGDLVMIYHETGSVLDSASKKKLDRTIKDSSYIR